MTGNVLDDALPAAVYDDPSALANAFADGSLLDNIEPLDPFGSNDGGIGDQLT